MPHSRTLIVRALAIAGAVAVIAVAHTASLDAAAARTPEFRRYVFGILRKGPKWKPGSSPALDSLQAAHLAHLDSMWKSGKLVAAGPVSGSPDWRGLLIFNTDSTELMRALAEKDPAVRAGRLAVNLWDWYAPPGVGDGYNRRFARLGEGADSMVTRWAVFLHRGPKFTNAETPEQMALIRDHLSYLVEEVTSRRAPVAGPLVGMEESDPLGLLVFSTDSLQAWTRANADPAVQSGRYRIQMVRWWCAYGVLPGEEGS